MQAIVGMTPPRRDRGAGRTSPTHTREDVAMNVEMNAENTASVRANESEQVMVLIWGPRATEGMAAMAQGGYTEENLQTLRLEILQWVRQSYQNWQPNARQRRSFRVRHTENVSVRRTLAPGGNGPDRVTVDSVEAD
jgi:hypothetical protein